MILSSKLDMAFRCYKEQSLAKRRSSFAKGRPTVQSQGSRDLVRGASLHNIRNSLLHGATGMPPSQVPAPQDNLSGSEKSDGSVELDALDLEMFLDIPRDMAQEMVFW